MNTLTDTHKALLRDAAGVGIKGGTPTRRNLSLYLTGRHPEEVTELVGMGYMRGEDRGGLTTYYITDSGIDAGESGKWWPR